MGIELEITKPMKVKAKELRLCCKVRDGFTASLVDDQGETIHEQEAGYVPAFMPGDHYGDYVILNIDIETGVVTNWEKPGAQNLSNWIDGGER